ncbi:phage holin family protein [Robertmurraya siralis]|uniref:phage holin family protein n=1 Tax=Robertmurraya siralis TaxID=77777 RepID=UPI0010F87A47|nr:phage holin family protein [Robertmurraya siralis]
MNWEMFYKIGATGIGAIVGYLFGGWSILLQILLALVIIDYISGLLASGVEGKLSSKIGFKGIAKKIMIFCLVAVGHLVDKSIGDGSMIQNAIIFFYLGNELLSIIENAGRTGLRVPEQLKSAVAILQGKGDGQR